MKDLRIRTSVYSDGNIIVSIQSSEGGYVVHSFVRAEVETFGVAYIRSQIASLQKVLDCDVEYYKEISATIKVYDIGEALGVS